jgi:O-antigen/teichoic acid export membrane protein
MNSGTPTAGWAGWRGLSETALVNLLLLALGALTGIITARVLGPEGRGALALALSIAAVATVVAGLGLQQALAYQVARNPEQRREAVALAIWIGLLAGGVAAAVVYVLAGLFIDADSAEDATKIAVLTIPASAVGGSLAGLVQGMRAARPFNLLRLAPPAGYAVLLVAAVALGAQLSAEDVALLYLGALLAATALSLYVVRDALRRLRRPSREFTTATVRYGLVVNVGSIAWTANRQLAIVVLGALASLDDVGLFSVALGYASPVGVASLALALHTLPDVAAEPDPFQQAVVGRRRIRMTILTTLPIMAAAVIAAPLLLPLAFGDEYSDAVGAAQMLAVGQAALGLSHVLSEISRGMGRPALPALAEGLGVTLSLVVLPLVVPPFGLIGAAASGTVIFFGVSATLYAGLRQHLEPGPRPT